MSEQDTVFARSIPEIYGWYLAPLLFAAYAADPHAQVLETATGTGVVSGTAMRHLSEGARHTATDLNKTMLDRARRPAAR